MEDIYNVVSKFSVAAEGLAALASIIFYQKYKETPLRYLPFFLTAIFILEFFGHDLSELFDGVNAGFFNALNSLFHGYMFYVFYHYLKKPTNKRIVLVGFFLFVGALIHDVITKEIMQSYTITYITAGCFIIIAVVLYFLEMLNSSRVLNIRQDLMFWIGVGLILFYVGYLPIKITRLAFVKNVDNQFWYLYIIHHILIIILYGCITVGLVWKKKN